MKHKLLNWIFFILTAEKYPNMIILTTVSNEYTVGHKGNISIMTIEIAIEIEAAININYSASLK